MVQKCNGSGRRIFTFPAVHPCDDIDPPTLLTSLINLSLKVGSFKPKFFSSNGRNAREALRQVDNLLVFLEEIRITGSGLPESAVLGFSELHLALQKMQFLLEDCTRDGARLWMLMKSERVANQFRVFIRALATGLDVLPLGFLDLPGEMEELVELMMRQARKTRFEVDPDDRRAMNQAMAIINQFESGFVPDKSDLERVLDHLDVRKRSDCNKEIKFLDSEIGFEYSIAEKKRELELLSSLMGFMTYCRCVLFDSVDGKAGQEVDQCGSEFLNFLNSDDFRCPISLEVMKDPVTVETGHTYDRSSILKWFRAGNATCPNTGNRLSSTDVVPNLVLKHLIQQYCIENGLPVADSNRKNRDITRTVLAGSLAADGAMKMVASFLATKLASGGGEERNKAAREIRLLSKASIYNRSCLVEASVIPFLLELLLSKDSMSQENAIAALLNLSKHSKSKAVIVENGGLESIVGVLKKGIKMEARQHAAATLFYLASIEEYRKLIGESTEAIQALVQMAKEGNDRGKKNALVAIYALLMHPGNHWRVLAAGAVPLLLNLLTSSDREELVTDSLAVLATLAEKPDGAKAILSYGALPQIVRTLEFSTSRGAKEQCVCLLLALCFNGGADVVANLVVSPSLTGSLYSQLSEGTSRASKKASALITLLHEFFERSSGSKTPALPRDRFVHVW